MGRVRWRLAVLLFDLVLLAATVTVVRDVLVNRVLNRIAQGTLNALASASVESIGGIELTAEGNVVVQRPRVTTTRGGAQRLFFQSERIEIHVDGNPLRERDVEVMRVDLHHPEIFFVREADGEWNATWALRKSPAPASTPPPPPSTIAVASPPPRDRFPRNGVHIHGGLMHIVFVAPGGKETRWDIGGVEGVMRKQGGALLFERWTGTFYGGEFRGDASIASTDPFVMEMELSVMGADIRRMAEKVMTKPVTGEFDLIFSVRADRAVLGAKPVAAGRAAVTGGKLWDLPPFVGVLAAFALTPTEDNIIEQAQLEFTVDREIVRIDRMDFLGRPLSLFGSGTMDLDGRNLDLTLVPRIGKSFGDIVPVAGHLFQALLDVAKGIIVPIRIGGSFWKPQVGIERDAKVDYAGK